VKFGLLTSKRELLATTTLFRRIKHAYDKQEEMVFHREAFLTPPLFTQLCRKFRSRELPVAMLDVLLMREFSVEEINAQAVAKAFIDGARMVHLLDEQNLIADIDQLAAQQPPRRELASPPPPNNVFRQQPQPVVPATDEEEAESTDTLVTDGTEETQQEEAPPVPTLTVRSSPRNLESREGRENTLPLPASRPAPPATTDAIASLFGLGSPRTTPSQALPATSQAYAPSAPATSTPPTTVAPSPQQSPIPFRIQLTGPGINTELDLVEVEDLALIRALLDKIERQLKR